ncbi:MAG: ABC transporter ATP-binding protein [Anaerolineae bacterium]|nr:ABC transporter ATP-binding protein [Anaerolineae bacterium]
MDIAIKTEGLTKRYPSQKNTAAIREIDLEIPRGILFGLVGPDGAGKTTILRILSSVMEPSSGKAWIAGFDTHAQAEAIRKRIGYMPQNFSLYPDLSVRENLDFFADIQQVPTVDKKKRIAEMLAFTHLADIDDRRAGKLSGGMKKKLALACAMVHGPQVLILDEPSTGVDPVSRRELWVILARVVQEGVTVLVSTPYMDEAERCHQVGMLYQGRLLTAGSPDEIVTALPFEIVEVKARPRKRMRQIVAETDDVLDWHPVGDRLRVVVSGNGTTGRTIRSLERQFKANKLEISILRPARRTMEDAFVHLVKGQREQA